MKKPNLLLMLLILLSLVPIICAEENNLSYASSITESEDLSSFTEKIVSPSIRESKDSSSSIEKITSDSEINLDRTISILNIIVTGIGVFIALIGIIIMIAIALGFFEYRRWKSAREDIESEVKAAEKAVKEIEKIKEEIKKRDEEEINKTIENLKTKPIQDVTKEEIEDIKNKLKILEVLGSSAKDEYFIKGLDLFNKGNYKLAIKEFEKIIEINPNDYKAWNGKGAAHFKLGQNEEALKAY
ncbi:MAG: tetratricopeptide repeat protein, partial [Nanoarchaeota archaeon]|nr:tetratricopeptide repeat protein [Nanoarchaeota archaeon]